MDFTYLLELAKANEEKSKKESSQRFSTKVSNAKKIEKGPRIDAVKAHLDRLETKKKEEKVKYKKDRDELLQRRALEKGTKRKLSAMIKRTKGASKSVLDDAKDLITEKGDLQCDDDDYGYESLESQKIFSKLKVQYNETPEDERLKFKKTEKKDIRDIKARVMSSLKVEEEKDLGIRKRTRKRKSALTDDFINDDDEYKKFDDSPSTADKNEKVHKSSADHKYEKHKKDKHEKERDKERHKEKHQKEKIYEEKKKRKEEAERRKKKLKAKAAPPPMSFKDLLNIASTKKANPLPLLPQKVEPVIKEKESEYDRPMTAKEKKEFEEERLRKLRRMGKLPPEDKKVDRKEEKTREKELKNAESTKQKQSNELSKSNQQPPPKRPLSENSKFFSVPSYEKNVPASSKENSKDLPPKLQSSMKEKTVPPKNNKIQSKRPLSPPSRRPPFPVKKQLHPGRMPPPSSFRRIEDSEDECDSEMDDFIDDGELECDYSNEIGKIFGYDRSKYSNVDDDDSDMEVSYAQVEREEKKSAKIGLREDLEDIRREEEEKKQKRLRQSEKLKGSRRK